jgi:hypothetical protein
MFFFLLSRTFVFIGVNYAPASSTILFPYWWFAAKRRSSWLNSVLIALFLVDLTGCATTSTHQFAELKADWQTRTGQLLYRNPKTTVIGDVVIRFSKAGNFELTFSKGPGVNLLTLRQDTNFAEVKGPIAGRGWSGSIDRAPEQLRGWLELRDKIVHARDRHQVRHVSGSETFLFRF